MDRYIFPHFFLDNIHLDMPKHVCTKSDGILKWKLPPIPIWSVCYVQFELWKIKHDVWELEELEVLKIIANW